MRLPVCRAVGWLSESSLVISAIPEPQPEATESAREGSEVVQSRGSVLFVLHLNTAPDNQMHIGEPLLHAFAWWLWVPAVWKYCHWPAGCKPHLYQGKWQRARAVKSEALA